MATSLRGAIIERVAETVAQARSREKRAYTLGRAVEAIREDSFDPVRRLLLACRTLKVPIGLSESYRAGLHGLPQMP